MLSLSFHALAQSKLDQKELLSRFVGRWESVNHAPKSKITVESKLNGLSINWLTYERTNKTWNPVRSEMYSFDQALNSILSFGTNANGQVYKGRGTFVNPNRMEIKNIGSHNTLFSNVVFELSTRELLITTIASGDKEGPTVKYRKAD